MRTLCLIPFFTWAVSVHCANPISFSAKISPSEFNSTELQDVNIELVFENTSNSVITLYPGAARYTEEAGWLSPAFEVLIEKNKVLYPLIQLRNYYGPPGMPPGEKYFEQMKIKIRPNEKYTYEIKSCFIPAKKLTKENLSLETLDPEGMDGLKRYKLSESSVLVFGLDCKKIKSLMHKVDFLSPGIFVPLKGAGSFDFKIKYTQKEWMSFKPEKYFELEAKGVSVFIGN